MNMGSYKQPDFRFKIPFTYETPLFQTYGKLTKYVHNEYLSKNITRVDPAIFNVHHAINLIEKYGKNQGTKHGSLRNTFKHFSPFIPRVTQFNPMFAATQLSCYQSTCFSRYTIGVQFTDC